MPISDVTAAPQGTGRGSAQESRDPLSGRLGLSVPHEWWPAAPLLKSYEAAGFSWVQLDAPPLSVLINRRACIEHAAAVWESVATTGLTTVIHAPGGLRAGSAAGDHAFGCLLSYAAEAGATRSSTTPSPCPRATKAKRRWPRRPTRWPGSSGAPSG